MLATIFSVVILVTLGFPRTPIGRAFHRTFVEFPLEFAERVERRHLLLLLILLCCGQSLALLGSVDLALAYAVDLSLYADAAIATSLAAGSARLASAGRFLKRSVRRIARPRRRSKRARGRRVQRVAACNDDEPAPAGLAA